MKKGITIRCGAGAAAALAIFAIGALTGQPLLSAACDGFFLAALLLLFLALAGRGRAAESGERELF